MFQWKIVDICHSGEEYPTQNQAERFQTCLPSGVVERELGKQMTCGRRRDGRGKDWDGWKKGWRSGWINKQPPNGALSGGGGQTPIHNNTRGHRLWTVALTPLISPPYVRRSLRASAALPQFLFQPELPQEKAAADWSYGAGNEIKACVSGTASGPTSSSGSPNRCSESILLSKNDQGSNLKIIKKSFTKKKRKTRNAKIPRLK